MKNEIKVFDNEEFGMVRSVIINGDPWFVGKDVAVTLGYKDTADAIKKHVYDEDKLTRRFSDSGQNREMYVINESGLYSLVLRSKLPTARKFEHWITSDVLPKLRRTGYYSMNNKDQRQPSALMLAHEETIRVQRELIDNLKIVIDLTNENARLKEEIIYAKNLHNQDSSSSTSFANNNPRKDIKLHELYQMIIKGGCKLSVKEFYDDLASQGFIEKGETGVYKPTESAVNSNMFITQKKKYRGSSYVITMVPPKTQDILRAKYAS